MDSDYLKVEEGDDRTFLAMATQVIDAMSFLRGQTQWQLDRVKGTDRKRVVALLGQPPAPRSGTVLIGT